MEQEERKPNRISSKAKAERMNRRIRDFFAKKRPTEDTENAAPDDENADDVGYQDTQDTE